MLKKLTLIVPLVATCLLVRQANAQAQTPGPLRVTMAVEPPIAYCGDRLWLNVSITNLSNRPFLAPNIKLGRPEHSIMIDAGILQPQVINAKGEWIPKGNYAEFFLGDKQLVLTLQPGETITARTNISYLWDFDRTPGDYAVTAPVVDRYIAPLGRLQPFLVSNTSFIRLLPRPPKVERRELGGTADAPRLTLRVTAGERQAHSQQAPLRLDQETYLPADTAAALLQARLNAADDRIILERNGKRLVFSTEEKLATLPSGTQRKDVAVPLAGGKEPMVPLSLLAEAFGLSKQVSWRVEIRG